MIELIVVSKLCRKNRETAIEQGREPAGYVFLTLALWFGFEIIGFLLGMASRSWVIAYILGLFLAAAGGFISHIIVVNLKQREYTAPEETRERPLMSPAQVTVVRRESSALNSFNTWDISLNGEDIGKIEDGASVTVMTNERNNILTARDPNGSKAEPYEFSVGSGWISEVTFNEGRFGNAHRTGLLP